MGTSKGYKMPTGGNWTPLKNEATAFVQGTGGPDVTAANLLTDFIRANGGFKGLSRGNGGGAPSPGSGSISGGSGGGGVGGGGSRSAAIGTARNLGGFLSRVGEVGFQEALRERGLEAVIGKPAVEVAEGFARRY